MSVLRRILSEMGIEHPDGRPLYALPMTAEKQSELRKQLSTQIAARQVLGSTAACFVLWSAEHIRSEFSGGQLTWDFVFGGLGLSEDQQLGRELVNRGLSWWRRKVRNSEAGIHLYLYTLMAEGGLPQALLMQQGLYARVVKGLLAEVEYEGTDIPQEVAYGIARRRIADLPQTFQTEDIARLLGDLAITLAQLRVEPPPDVPFELIDRWLDLHRPDWVQSLPLRLSREAADSLIRRALREERKSIAVSGPLARRTLVRNETNGEWRSIVRLAAEGVLSKAMLPSGSGLRLRFLPVGLASERGGAVVYSASPDENGWELRRIGAVRVTALPLDLDVPLILAGFADGRLMGEVEIAPALPLPNEEPSLWKAAEESESDNLPAELLPVGGQGKTRASRIWLLTEAAAPAASEGVVVGSPLVVPWGRLWPLSGVGEIRLGESRWQISTGAEEDLPETRLMVGGPILPGWRLAGNGGHVLLGNPVFYGQRDSGMFRRLSNSIIRTRPTRLLMGEIAEWVEKDTVLARLRYVALPEKARITLLETCPGELELQAEGLPHGLFLALEAGQVRERLRLSDDSGKLTLSVEGAPPGILTLRLHSPEEGKTLEIVGPWPARSGMILDPDNNRLMRDMPLSVEALRGWRAILPRNVQGEVQFRLDGQLCVAMRVEGETPLAAHIPLIRSMLAHAGPDAQVRLSLITGGQESRRLEIRRYQRQASIVNGGWLHLGLSRDAVITGDTVFSSIATRGKVVLHAVDLNAPDRVIHHECEAHGNIDLRSILPAENTVWLIQATLKGEMQRATVWSPSPIPFSRREERITKYFAAWKELSESADRSEWDRQWALIRAATEGGDAGVLDQVQALARVPQAAIRLGFRVPRAELDQVLALDTAAPIFWPAFSVTDFYAALIAEYSCLIQHYTEVLEDEQEARNDVAAALARRIGGIISLHPELAVHFGAAIVQANLLSAMPAELLQKVVVSPSEKRCVELAQEAARRIDWLPSGVRDISARYRPSGLPSFNSHIQPLIEAPLVTAEIAAGLRPNPGTASVLALVNLRLIDPVYFNAALPVALALALQRAGP